MRGRILFLGIWGSQLAACGGGPSAPPALAYRLPDEPAFSYLVTDTAVITIEMLGQSMALDMGATARYEMAFGRAADGLTVTLSVADLDATLGVPMAGPMSFDEGSVQGDLVFTLDRRGEVTVLSTPDVDELASQLLPAEQVAHSFFPALPGTAVRVGDAWSDTLLVEGEGTGSLHNVLDYTVVGDTIVDGASLLHISIAGTSEVTQTMSMQGTELEQTTSLVIEGHVLWDLQRGVMFERATHMSGTGTVQTPLLPARLPTRFEMRSRARLVQE